MEGQGRLQGGVKQMAAFALGVARVGKANGQRKLQGVNHVD